MVKQWSRTPVAIPQELYRIHERRKKRNAIRTLDSYARGTARSLKDKIGDKTVAQIQAEKHTEGQPINRSCLVRHEKANPMPFHSSIFDKIDDNAIERAAQKTKWSHGSSVLDSCQWRRLLTSYDQASINLRKTVVKLAHRVATEVLPSTSLEAYNNSRLIPLEKCPCVRPNVFGEVLRRIIGRCIWSCLGAVAQRMGGNI